MTDLADDQLRFMKVLQNGPSDFPEGLFADPKDRALLGLKAHANTISHARLIALEDSYPRTRERLGHAEFNAVSRSFIELAEVRRRKLATLGQGFPGYLAQNGFDAAACDLATVEWAWLHVYHAADASPLELADLAGLDEAGLLDLDIVPHPAWVVAEVQSDIADLLPELAARIEPGMRHVLIARPDAEVLLSPLSPFQAGLAARVRNCLKMRNLLAEAIETTDEAEALPAIFALIGAGLLANPQG